MFVKSRPIKLSALAGSLMSKNTPFRGFLLRISYALCLEARYGVLRLSVSVDEQRRSPMLHGRKRVYAGGAHFA
jgi:hypothetical protein